MRQPGQRGLDQRGLADRLQHRLRGQRLGGLADDRLAGDSENCFGIGAEAAAGAGGDKNGGDADGVAWWRSLAAYSDGVNDRKKCLSACALQHFVGHRCPNHGHRLADDQPALPSAPIDLGYGVAFATPVILAPMSGVTDLPFRRLAKRLGAGLVVSEMIASWAMVRENRNTMRMAALDEAADRDPACRLRAGGDGGGRAHRRRSRRRYHRYQFRLPGQEGCGRSAAGSR